MTRSVLVVDDDDAIREVARLALELTAGWSVRTAASGGDAVVMAGSEPPDVLLLDVMMPRLDGHATVDLLRAEPRTRDLPVIFLTAKGAGAGEDGPASTVAGVIAKPFDPMTLADRIAAILGWAP